MNMLLGVFVLLCIGAVYCGRSGPTPPGPEPTGSPLWDLRRCYAQHGGWFDDNLPTQNWPVSNNPKVFYVGCKVWRPTWSSCKGYCESSQNITTRIPPRYDTDCKCCKSYRYQLVRAYPRCWVIRIDHGRLLSVRFQTVREYAENYSYALAGKCGCQDCGRRFIVPERPEEIDEDQVTGRPNPPEVTETEREAELATAFREIPALRGVAPNRELF